MKIRGALVAAGLLLVGAVHAEDVEKKVRVSLSVGAFQPQDRIRSNAGNQLSIRCRSGLFDPACTQRELVQLYQDPRNDASVLGALDVNSDVMARATVQYAFSKIWLAELSVGYSKSPVGDVEMQFQSIQTFPDVDINDFEFEVFEVPAGELERIPIEASIIARFRPRSTFNPYFGAGVGVSVIGFEPGEEFNELSQLLDASEGVFRGVTGTLQGTAIFQNTTLPPSDLGPARVIARDTYTFHTMLGAEYSFKRKWAVYLDLRYIWASRTIDFSFNGDESLGESVPNLTVFDDDPTAAAAAAGRYGAVEITSGGLVDSGSLQPRINAPPGTDCVVSPGQCEFVVGALDGELDLGFYYLQGGSIDLSAFDLQAGIRFTF